MLVPLLDASWQGGAGGGDAGGAAEEEQEEEEELLSSALAADDLVDTRIGGQVRAAGVRWYEARAAEGQLWCCAAPMMESLINEPIALCVCRCATCCPRSCPRCCWSPGRWTRHARCAAVGLSPGTWWACMEQATLTAVNHQECRAVAAGRVPQAHGGHGCSGWRHWPCHGSAVCAAAAAQVSMHSLALPQLPVSLSSTAFLAGLIRQQTAVLRFSCLDSQTVTTPCTPLLAGGRGGCRACCSMRRAGHPRRGTALRWTTPQRWGARFAEGGCGRQ